MDRRAAQADDSAAGSPIFSTRLKGAALPTGLIGDARICDDDGGPARRRHPRPRGVEGPGWLRLTSGRWPDTARLDFVVAHCCSIIAPPASAGQFSGSTRPALRPAGLRHPPAGTPELTPPRFPARAPPGVVGETATQGRRRCWRGAAPPALLMSPSMLSRKIAATVVARWGCSAHAVNLCNTVRRAGRRPGLCR